MTDILDKNVLSTFQEPLNIDHINRKRVGDTCHQIITAVINRNDLTRACTHCVRVVIKDYIEVSINLYKWPCKYDASDLTAEGNDIAIETLEFAFEQMERVI